ncbi:MAG: biopolymer transporter ExbD [Crocinitomicaceae bacterium]|nr:biopolymer transporter ExbD [Crocinitomicaceae bacterium]
MVKRNKRFHAEVATSSLSDIMFFLLLFFLIISTLANPNVIKMTLPKSKTNEKTNKQLISLSVTEDKRFYLDKEEVAFDQLETALLSKIGASKDQTVVVRIPFNLQVQDLVDVLQIGVKNKLKFVIATKEDALEADKAVQEFRTGGFRGPVYFMPCGGVESVYSMNAKNVAIEAMNRGYRYSDRLQVPLFKNEWGT